jgi:hypothetical protein
MAPANEGPFVVSEPCPVCRGRGTIDEQPCAACHGTGVQRFYHGTKADLKPGGLIEPGHSSNFGKRKLAGYVYLTGTLDAATGGRSWRSAKVSAGSTWWNRPARSRTTPI